MFERLTDRARKVMALANQEAKRFKHEYIGTEHILLGLVNEGSGVGANVLKNLNVDLTRMRAEVEKLVKPGADSTPTADRLPQTPRAKKVIEYAIEEACDLGHGQVGTEHFLLGLLRESDGVAAHVLTNLGIDLRGTRQEIMTLLGAGGDVEVNMEYDVFAAVDGRRVRPPDCIDLKTLIDICIKHDPRLRQVEYEIEKATRNADYERVADLNEEADKVRRLLPAKQRAVRHILARDASVAFLVDNVLKDLPDEPVTPGRFLLELIAEHPQLAKRLRPIMNRIRVACTPD